MSIFFYAVFASLAIIAGVCQILLAVTNHKMRKVERRILDRYRSKIDKIPAIVMVLRNHSKKLEEYDELTDLHRIAIISPVTNIYDVLEINSHITDRFSFMMRMALSIRTTSRDGTFITIRESITSIEGQIRELLIEYSQLTKTYNSILRAREYTILGSMLPGSRKPMIQAV